MSVGRFPVAIFVLISVAGLGASVQAMLDPVGFLGVFRDVAGADPSAIAARDPEAERALVFLGRWIATALWGSDGITLLLALSAFRTGHPAAWWAFWYWPIMFVAHAALYAPGTTLWYVQFVNLTLSVVALLVARRAMSRGATGVAVTPATGAPAAPT